VNSLKNGIFGLRFELKLILCILFTMLKAAKNMRGKLALLYRVTGRPGHRLHIFLNSTYAADMCCSAYLVQCYSHPFYRTPRLMSGTADVLGGVPAPQHWRHARHITRYQKSKPGGVEALGAFTQIGAKRVKSEMLPRQHGTVCRQMSHVETAQNRVAIGSHFCSA